MNKSFRRILGLVRRTGDRMVVSDPEGEDAFVVMDLDQYELLLASSSRTAPQTRTAPAAPQDSPADLWEAMPPAGESADTWDVAKLSEPERVDLEKQYQACLAQKKEERGIGQVHKAAELKETPPKGKNDQDFGEEQFYLEPVE